jgi:crotonobetainyl-CoA:carnitine CoA-transferase CaiB-like acyl-CoA transferase
MSERAAAVRADAESVEVESADADQADMKHLDVKQADEDMERVNTGCAETEQAETAGREPAYAADKPLRGMTVLDFSQFLSGPYAGLRLGDLGARVIKIENPNGGDLCRRLYISNLEIDGDSSLFHAINRNKESFAVDLKEEQGRGVLLRLLEKADVMIQNFRPGVIKRLGLDYSAVRSINPRIVYGSISGYGTEGPLVGRPGQDLLVQSLTGLPWLSGEEDEPPVPFGLAVADMSAGAALTEGILAALVRRGVNGEGALVEVSLLEATLDLMQTELSELLNSEAQKENVLPRPERATPRQAPLGIYKARDGYLAVGACTLPELCRAIGALRLEAGTGGSDTAGTERMERQERQKRRERQEQHLSVRRMVQERIAAKTMAEWLALLEAAGIPCAEVLDWSRLVRHDGFRSLGMVQRVVRSTGTSMKALRCPIRFDGRRILSAAGSPGLGEHNGAIAGEFGCALQ